LPSRAKPVRSQSNTVVSGWPATTHRPSGVKARFFRYTPQGLSSRARGLLSRVPTAEPADVFGQRSAVRRERDTTVEAQEGLQPQFLLPRGRVIQPHRPELPRRSKHLAVRREDVGQSTDMFLLPELAEQLAIDGQVCLLPCTSTLQSGENASPSIGILGRGSDHRNFRAGRSQTLTLPTRPRPPGAGRLSTVPSP